MTSQDYEPGQAPKPAAQNVEYVSFSSDVSRAAEVEYAANNVFSSARVGKQISENRIEKIIKLQEKKPVGRRKTREEIERATYSFSPNEDNGFAASYLTDEPISQQNAEAILKETYAKACNGQKPKKPSQIGCTAASAVLTTEGVSFRGAGDGYILAIGDKGQAIVLNELHDDKQTAQGVTHLLSKGYKKRSEDSKGFHSWKDLKSKLRSNDVRILVMSDGCIDHPNPKTVAGLTHLIIHEEKLDINDPHFSQSFIDALKKVETKTFPNPTPQQLGKFEDFLKEDDKIVISATIPQTPEEQCIMHAFDGIGSGGHDSGIFAEKAAEAALETTMEHFPNTKTTALTVEGGKLSAKMQAAKNKIEQEQQAQNTNTTSQPTPDSQQATGKVTTDDQPEPDKKSGKNFSMRKTAIGLGALGTVVALSNGNQSPEPEAGQQPGQPEEPKKQNWFQRNAALFGKILLVFLAVDMTQSQIRGTQSLTGQAAHKVGIGKFTDMILGERNKAAQAPTQEANQR